jgi:hypothetical protein
MLIALAILPNDEAEIAAAELVSSSVGRELKFREFIKLTIQDFLGPEGILRRRREVSGLQLPSYEACLAPSLR